LTTTAGNPHTPWWLPDDTNHGGRTPGLDIGRVTADLEIGLFIASMLLILSAEIGRRIAERRYGREFSAQGLASTR
jgi:hypothetical protein